MYIWDVMIGMIIACFLDFLANCSRHVTYMSHTSVTHLILNHPKNGVKWATFCPFPTLHANKHKQTQIYTTTQFWVFCHLSLFQLASGLGVQDLLAGYIWCMRETFVTMDRSRNWAVCRLKLSSPLHKLGHQLLMTFQYLIQTVVLKTRSSRAAPSVWFPRTQRFWSQ